jgi:uncharacterized spore protein YtfJ
MTKTVLGIDKPVSVKGFTIIPVVKLSLHYSFAAGISIFSIKQPIATVIVSASQRKAISITGETISLEQLIQEVPSIKETLEEIQPYQAALS